MTLAIDNELAHLAGDISQQPFAIERGTLAVPDAPGLGVDVDPELVARYEVDDIRGAYLDPNRPGWFPTKPAY
jgi:glucarate dehydratase